MSSLLRTARQLAFNSLWSLSTRSARTHVRSSRQAHRRASGVGGRRDAEHAVAARSRKARPAIPRGDFRPCDPRRPTVQAGASVRLAHGVHTHPLVAAGAKAYEPGAISRRAERRRPATPLARWCAHPVLRCHGATGLRAAGSMRIRRGPLANQTFGRSTALGASLAEWPTEVSSGTSRVRLTPKITCVDSRYGQTSCDSDAVARRAGRAGRWSATRGRCGERWRGCAS